MKIVTNVITGEVTHEPYTDEELAQIEASKPSEAELLTQWRNTCKIRRAALKLALDDAGLLSAVETAIQTAPKAMQIKWAEEESFKRLDSDLVNFAKTQLSMSDSEIDDLFKLAETK